MARPTRTNAEYFYHPASFRNDRRVKALRARYGACGYGLLMMLIELLTDADNTALATDEMELELLAGDLNAEASEVAALIAAAEKVGLFGRNEQGLLKCEQLDTWLAPVFEKRNRSRAAAAAGQKSNALWMQHTQAVFARDGHKCRHCGTTDDLTLDHIVPRSAGGSDEIINLQTLCSRCNSAKGSNLSQSVTVIPPVENSTVQSVENSTEESLPSVEEAASAAPPPEKKIGPDQPSENPAPGSAHQGRVADVPTRKRKGRQQKPPRPDPGSARAADYALPEWASARFAAEFEAYLVRRQAMPKPLLATSIQATLNRLGEWDEAFCLNLLAKSAEENWQGLIFDNTPHKFTQHVLQLQQLQAHANRINQPERGAKPTEAASFGARALSAQLRAIREERSSQNGSHVHLGAAAGTNAGLGAAVPPGVGAPKAG